MTQKTRTHPVKIILQDGRTNRTFRFQHPLSGGLTTYIRVEPHWLGPSGKPPVLGNGSAVVKVTKDGKDNTVTLTGAQQRVFGTTIQLILVDDGERGSSKVSWSGAQLAVGDTHFLLRVNQVTKRRGLKIELLSVSEASTRARTSPMPGQAEAQL